TVVSRGMLDRPDRFSAIDRHYAAGTLAGLASRREVLVEPFDSPVSPARHLATVRSRLGSHQPGRAIAPDDVDCDCSSHRCSPNDSAGPGHRARAWAGRLWRVLCHAHFGYPGGPSDSCGIVETPVHRCRPLAMLDT